MPGQRQGYWLHESGQNGASSARLAGNRQDRGREGWRRLPVNPDNGKLPTISCRNGKTRHSHRDAEGGYRIACGSMREIPSADKIVLSGVVS
jgi:hypothetical protein